jgi:hypothetical protein
MLASSTRVDIRRGRRRKLLFVSGASLRNDLIEIIDLAHRGLIAANVDTIIYTSTDTGVPMIITAENLACLLGRDRGVA